MLKHWILAARPKTLFAGISPVAIGSALAYLDRVFHLPSALAALTGAMCIQVGTNFCNDYFDFFQGADTDDRKGPTRAVQAGWITPAAMLRATLLMFALLGLICVYLVSRAGWPIVVIGLSSVVFGMLYTAGRYSLAYLGLGDPFVLFFFGPVAVGGTYYVQSLSLPSYVALTGFAPGLISVGLLVVNNLRDIDEDRVANKRTLAVRFGASFVRFEYALCVLVAAVIPAGLWLSGSLPAAVAFSTISLVPAAFLTVGVWQNNGTALNRYLGMTAGLLLLFTTLFCVGCLFG